MSAAVISSVVSDQLVDAFIGALAEGGLRHVVGQTYSEVSGALSEIMDQHSPTAAFVGFGHCGETILRHVADELTRARASTEQVGKPPSAKLPDWIRSLIQNKSAALKNIEPLIFVGDLDKGAELERSQAGAAYPLLHELSFRSLASSGSGNMPAKAQYLSRLALAVTELPDKKKSNWRAARSTLIDTIGLAENNLRVVTYVFSSGGGSGSGFLYEIAQAQRFQQLRRLYSESSGSDAQMSDIAFTLGAAVMPGSAGSVDAQSINSGRLLCRYLADRYRASVNEKRPAMPAYHALMLFSNGTFEQLSMSAEDRIKRANKYISSQLLSVVLAQSQGVSADSSDLNSSADDLIRLDPSDLRHAVCGTAVVGFNFTKDTSLDIRALLIGCFRSPDTNSELFAGVSVNVGCYDYAKKYLEPGSKKEDQERIWAQVSDLDVFRYCPGVTVVLSSPKKQLNGNEVDDLRAALVELFPNARVRRLAIVEGELRSMTVFVSESGIFCQEAKRHLGNFIKNCFPEGDETGVENLSTVIGGECQLLAMKEAKAYLKQAASRLKVENVEFDDVLVKKQDVLDCLQYLVLLQRVKGLSSGLEDIEDLLSGGKDLLSRFSSPSVPDAGGVNAVVEDPAVSDFGVVR